MRGRALSVGRRWALVDWSLPFISCPSPFDSVVRSHSQIEAAFKQLCLRVHEETNAPMTQCPQLPHLYPILRYHPSRQGLWLGARRWWTHQGLLASFHGLLLVRGYPLRKGHPREIIDHHSSSTRKKANKFRLEKSETVASPVPLQ